MNIAYFNTYFYPDVGGGAEITLFQQVKLMKSMGNNVLVFCLGNKDGVHRDIVEGVDVIRVGLPPHKYFPLGFKQKSSLKRFFWHLSDIDSQYFFEAISSELINFAPDVASCHNLLGLTIGVWDGLKKLRIPIVQVLHDQYLLCPKTTMVCNGKVCEKQCASCKIFRLIHPYKSRNVDAVVGVSSYILNKLLSFGYFKKASIKAVVNNVRADFSPIAKEKKIESPVVFGFIGTITPVKGLDLLLDVFSKLRRKYNCRLLIAGGGDQGYVDNLKSNYPQDDVEFLGYLNPNHFFSKVDISIVPSIWHDTFPGVVFEALGSSVPVVGSRRGGIPEMIEDEVNGFLFDPDYPDELFSILERLLNDPKGITELSLNAKKSAEKYFDQESWIKKYISIYDSVAN